MAHGGTATWREPGTGVSLLMGGSLVEQGALLSRVPTIRDPHRPLSLHPWDQGHLLPGWHNPAHPGLTFSFQLPLCC